MSASTKKPSSLSGIFAKTMDEFSRNTSMHGFQYLTVRSDRTLLERCMWLSIQIVVIYWVFYLFLLLWNEFMEEPTVTTLESASYPITNLPFPGVSICNVNKISLARATKYAEYLSQKSGIDQGLLLHWIRYLGKLYDFGTVSSDVDLSIFQDIVNRFDRNNETGNFDPYTRLKELSVPCTELIFDCAWNGKPYDCQDLFIYESTMEGFCCIFNYASPLRNHHVSKIIQMNNRSKLYPLRAGVEGGLTLKVNVNVTDYYYPLVSSVGSNVHVFNSDDFPDTSSGNLKERIIPAGVEMFIRLYGTQVQAVDEVKRYPIAKRKCKFREEARTWFATKYTHSDCVLDCRLKTMLSLCNCIMFTFTKAIYGPPRPQCTLVDIPCMYRYKDKWRRLFPYDFIGDDELDMEKQDTLMCNHCMPTCSSTYYTVKNEHAYLSSGATNLSRINIFFESENAKLYKQDVMFYWYEIVSNFGGTCSLMMGLSLISCIEFVYYWTVRLCKYSKS